MTRTGERPAIEAVAHADAATAAEAYADLPRYLRALPVEAWGGRSGRATTPCTVRRRSPAG